MRTGSSCNVGNPDFRFSTPCIRDLIKVVQFGMSVVGLDPVEVEQRAIASGALFLNCGVRHSLSPFARSRLALFCREHLSRFLSFARPLVNAHLSCMPDLCISAPRPASRGRVSQRNSPGVCSRMGLVDAAWE